MKYSYPLFEELENRCKELASFPMTIETNDHQWKRWPQLRKRSLKIEEMSCVGISYNFRTAITKCKLNSSY